MLQELYGMNQLCNTVLLLISTELSHVEKITVRERKMEKVLVLNNVTNGWGFVGWLLIIGFGFSWTFG